MTTRVGGEPGSAGSVQDRWLTPGVAGIGLASLLADVGHEIPTALLPALLTATLGAPAAALGLIEGLADGAAGLADLGRREEALASVQEAVGIYRQLVAVRPDAFRPDLATSLNNLAQSQHPRHEVQGRHGRGHHRSSALPAHANSEVAHALRPA
jgi:hypothetical protein